MQFTLDLIILWERGLKECLSERTLHIHNISRPWDLEPRGIQTVCKAMAMNNLVTNSMRQGHLAARSGS